MSEKIPEAFDIWICRICKHRFEINIKSEASKPNCPKCESTILIYSGQVAR